jgi:hypothetical protein
MMPAILWAVLLAPLVAAVVVTAAPRPDGVAGDSLARSPGQNSKLINYFEIASGAVPSTAQWRCDRPVFVCLDQDQPQPGHGFTCLYG